MGDERTGPESSPHEVSLEAVRAAPKVLLHDHLDGGLRPATIVELADEIGHELPATDEDELAAWFRAGAETGDLALYLATFAHTVPLLQRGEALERVAVEAVADLAADGVRYAEIRFAPELHQQQGLSLDAAIEAVLAGLRRGESEMAAAGHRIETGLICCAMRTANRSVEVAEAALAHHGSGVVAFDLAGAETGYPPSEHRSALERVRQALMPLTLHASEPPGVELIADALFMGADRIGHGVRLIEDCERTPDGLVMGPVARWVRDAQVPLELCPTCNVQIGAVPTLADHPIGEFLRAGIRATVNTDNRLMSGVSVSSEYRDLAASQGLGWSELGRLAVNGAWSSFLPLPERQALVAEVAAGWGVSEA